MASTGQLQKTRNWTSDTQIAFLLALRLTGSVVAAAREIGRPYSSAAVRRKEDPAFAAKWQAVLDEKHWEKIAAEKARIAAVDPADTEPDTGEMPNRVRFDGWTPLRQRAFLRGLAETGKIERACKLAGISIKSARRMRTRYPSFAAAWDRAITKAEPTLEQVAVDRAVNGVSEPVYHAGEVVGHKRRYSDALMRDALKREDARLGSNKTKGDLIAEAHAAARLAGGQFYTAADEEKTRESLARKLDALGKGLRRADEANADRLRAAGLTP